MAVLDGPLKPSGHTTASSRLPLRKRRSVPRRDYEVVDEQHRIGIEHRLHRQQLGMTDRSRRALTRDGAAAREVEREDPFVGVSVDRWKMSKPNIPECFGIESAGSAPVRPLFLRT